jgi:hypothetical protein
VILLTVAYTLPNLTLKGDQIRDPITPFSAAISPPIFCAHLDPLPLPWPPPIFPCHVAIEDVPTPNMNEIVVFASFFQYGFGPPICDFLHSLLDYYQIELVHLNPNSILQIAIFIHLCEAYLGIPPNIP